MHRIQVSLRRLIWVSFIGTALVAVNSYAYTTEGVIDIMTVGVGQRETLHIERGFPLRYQQSDEWLIPGSLTDEVVADRERRIRITHPHWLVVNSIVALGIAFGVPYAVRRMPALFKRKSVNVTRPSRPHLGFLLTRRRPPRMMCLRRVRRMSKLQR